MDFLEIYDSHYDRVHKFIVAVVKDEWTADDLTQETFIRVQTQLHAVRDVSKISAWLFRIAHRLCLDHFRSASRIASKEPGARDPFGDLEGGLAQRFMEQHQMGVCVQNHMSRLPENLRTVLVFYDVLGLNHKEIANILGVSIENAKTRLHRARKKLKVLLKESCTFERDERNVLVCAPR